MTFTTKDFIDWKSNPVTKAVLQDYRDRIDRHKDILSFSAGKEPLEDRFHAGYIQAFRDALDVDVGELSND